MRTPNFTGVAFGEEEPLLDDPAENYFEASKLHRDMVTVEVPGILRLAGSPTLVEGTARAGKRYSSRPSLRLPEVVRAELPLVDALRGRHTPDTMVPPRPVGLEEVALWCWAADGATHRLGAHHVARTAPSGGALYPRDLYLWLREEGPIRQGLHHYDPNHHVLAHVAETGLSELAATTAQPESFENAAAVAIMTASFWRNRFKYNQRALRFALMEAGHVAQNLLLAVRSGGRAARPVGGFFDDELADLLALDGVNEAPLYLHVIGDPGTSTVPTGPAAPVFDQ